MYKQRNLLENIVLFLKGMAMGAADVVPGVSGGTIAFISGIYEELIGSISAINIPTFRLLFQGKFKEFWQTANGSFFLFLFSGILVSILSLAKIVHYSLEHYPVLLWSFFFGLVLASIVLIAKSITSWKALQIIAIIFGSLVAFYISGIQSTANVDAWWFIILSGAIAICAMILPGISGAFILVLLGSYKTIMLALKEFDLYKISLFAIGCLIGLFSFARVLKFLFQKYKNATLAILTGFLIGSLNKIWPWKERVSDVPIVIHSDGKKDYMMANILPSNYSGESSLLLAIIMMVIGFSLILLLEKIAAKK